MDSADAEVMNHEPFETAVCAASDLAARLARELTQALTHLEHAERCFDAAAVDAEVIGAPIPFPLRRNRNERRREVAMLRHVLAGMPTIHGGRHAASA
jgi:hypothetical protein